MSATAELILTAYAAQLAEAAILAGVLAFFYGVYQRRYLYLWSLSWVAFGASCIGGGVGLALAMSTRDVSGLHASFSTLGQVAVFWQAVWLLAGTYELATSRRVSNSLLRRLLLVTLLVGLASALAWSRSGQEASFLRYFSRFGIRSGVSGAAFLVAAWSVWRIRHRSTGFGSSLLSASFAAHGLHELYNLGVSVYSLFARRFVAHAAYLETVETVLQMAIGLSMVIWLLEEERLQALRATAKADYLLSHDATTGLPNREAFLQLAASTASGAGGSKGIAVAVLSIERFKAISHAFGTRAAENLTRMLAHRLRVGLGEKELLGRVGEDELAVLMLEVGGDRRLSVRVDTLLATQERPFRIGEREFFLRLRVGSALSRAREVSVEDLLGRAGAALQSETKRDELRHAIFREDVASRASTSLVLENRLRRAWAEREFLLYFQPTITLEDRRISGVESLIRWRDPDRGIILPGDFLGAASSAGLMDELEQWVLRESLESLRRWHREGMTHLRMSVNLSAGQFEQARLVGRVERLLERTGVQPSFLELEVTETAALSMTEPTLRILAELKQLGVRVAIDDFGAGYSSFGYLGFLPADSLKIDRSLICNLGRREQDKAITAAIINLAKGLGLSVIAEGVELEDQASWLEQLGCHFGQGILFGEARSAEETFALLIASSGHRSPSRLA